MSRKNTVDLPLKWQFTMQHFPIKFAIFNACLGINRPTERFDGWVFELFESVQRALHITLYALSHVFSGRLCRNNNHIASAALQNI